MLLNNEQCKNRLTPIGLNPVELKYYTFLINLDKCNGSSNFVDGLSSKLCVPNKTKSVNFNVFNVITKINKAKTLIKHISCNCKCKFNSKTCN